MFNFFWSYQQISSIYTTIKNGAIYNRYAVADSRELTASGWRVMTRTEWDNLITFIGGSVNGGQYLKESGTTYWNDNLGLNTYGFNGRGSGNRVSSFSNIKVIGTFWTSTQTIPTFGRFVSLNSASNTINTSGASDFEGKSVRLICDSGNPTSYTGNDGKVYQTVTINGITYLADNLAETKFRNGDWINGYNGGTYTPISDASWGALTTEGMCFYNDDPTTYL